MSGVQEDVLKSELDFKGTGRLRAWGDDDQEEKYEPPRSRAKAPRHLARHLKIKVEELCLDWECLKRNSILVCCVWGAHQKTNILEILYDYDFSGSA